MPLLRVTTNQVLTPEITADIVRQYSSSVARLLGKPENYVMVILDINPNMSFAGTSDPLAYLELKSLGLPEDKTTEFSHALCELTYQLLGVQNGRVYIEFSSPARHFWGWNNTTF